MVYNIFVSSIFLLYEVYGAMLQKHRQFLIVIMGIVYVYTVCPLLCATLEQKLCHSEPAVTQASCCQKAEAAADTETPPENGELCCITELALVFPADETFNRHELPLNPIGVLSKRDTGTAPVVPQTSRALPLPHHLLYPAPPNCSLSRRGPPSTRS